MVVRQLANTEDELYRRVRLDALRGDPAAFGSSYERELAFGPADWRRRLEGFGGRPGVVFVDEIGEQCVGTAGVGIAEFPSGAIVWGMWVDPTVRRSGVGARLVEAAKDWASENGVEKILLHVMRANAGVVAFYERCGFALTGEAQLAPDDPCADELAMQWLIAD